MQRFIIEMGMGNDLHGRDYTKAAARAIEDAIRHSSIPLFGALEIDHSEMQVEVTVGVQMPDQVDTNALIKGLPRGNVTVNAVQGGLDITNPDTGELTVIASAAVEAFLSPERVRAS
ncbi:MAG: Lin0512 family protein [Paracoccaceae bacterium]